MTTLKNNIVSLVCFCGFIFCPHSECADFKVRVFAKFSKNLVEFKVLNCGPNVLFFSDPLKYPVVITIISNKFPNSFTSIQDSKLQPHWRSMIFLAPATKEYEDGYSYQKESKFKIPIGDNIDLKNISKINIELFIGVEEIPSKNAIIHSTKLTRFEAEIEREIDNPSTGK